MPLLLNGKPNPQAIMLGRQHLQKIMLGAEVVWQKFSSQLPIHGLTLESLESEESRPQTADGSRRKVKLVATNQNGNLRFPMLFPDHLRDDYQDYHDRLTFVGNAIASLQTIDAMLTADVVETEMHFPMFCFDEKPPEGTFDYRRNLTFIANSPPEPEGEDSQYLE